MFSPSLVGDGCHPCKHNLKTFHQDTDEEVVVDHVLEEEVVVFRGSILCSPQGQHHQEIENDRNNCGGHFAYHHQTPKI